ncbi:flagellin [Candidatus Puniceispirillum sp.]|nr:flagellin [Candidatus Puniceispirillum sp.]
MTVINTNSAALLARAYGQKANQQMLKPMERLSSGLRINSASDDAAGLAVVNKMTAAIKDYDLSIRNSVDTISLLITAESALSQINLMQRRLSELAVQSASGVYTQQDRDSMEMELYELVAEIDRIAINTKYNDVTLLDGSFTVKGASSRDIIPISLGEFATTTVGRYWEESGFANNDFSVSGPTTSLGNHAYQIPGWEIHNRRVELGEDGSRGPATINARDGNPYSNKIGNHLTPEDATPRPHLNDTAARDTFIAGNPGGWFGSIPGSLAPPNPGVAGQGTNDSSRPSNYGNLEDAGEKGFEITGGALKLSTGNLTSAFGADIVHGSYVISQAAAYIAAGESVSFDWKATGDQDSFDVYSYLLNVDTGDTIELLNETQVVKAATDWVNKKTQVNVTGNYKFVFVNGTYDATGGLALGASMYIDNVKIDRPRPPADQQHLVSQISVQTVAEAQNATNVLALAMEQTSSVQAQIGAIINRYQGSIEGSAMRGMDMREARSRIRDAEYTVETSKLAKQQILAEASTAMLAQANASKNAVLELIK